MCKNGRFWYIVAMLLQKFCPDTILRPGIFYTCNIYTLVLLFLEENNQKKMYLVSGGDYLQAFSRPVT